MIEAVGENGGGINFAVAVFIDEQAEALGVFADGGKFIAQVAHHESETVIGRAGSHVFIQPIHVAANIRDTSVQAERFGNVNAATLIDVKSNDVGGVRFSGDQFSLETGGKFERADGLFPFSGSGGDFGLILVGSGNDFGAESGGSG